MCLSMCVDSGPCLVAVQTSYRQPKETHINALKLLATHLYLASYATLEFHPGGTDSVQERSAT